MNAIVLVFAAALAVAQAGYLGSHGVVAHSVLAGARTTQLQGPSSSATIIGNDGLGIVAHAPGASITATEQVGGAAVAYHGAQAAYSAYASPAVVAHQGYAAHGYAAPAVVAHGYAAPAVVAHGYAAPALVAHQAYAAHGYAAPAVVAHHGINAYSGAVVAAYPHGHGIEGQYVHDHSERLFDDGSYKGELVY